MGFADFVRLSILDTGPPPPMRFEYGGGWFSGKFGTRIFDGFDAVTETAFEGTLLDWADSRFAGEVLRKIDQAAADWALLKTGAVKSVVWFGQHPLPTTGLGGQLKRTLEAAGILYYVVKP